MASCAVPERVRDAERTKADILAVATSEFAENGFAGARVDVITARTQTTKRMLYYYFGSKQGLFVAVLEAAYARIRGLEQQLDVEHLDPVEAIRELAELTFDHHEAHPDFIRLVSVENIHHGEHIASSATLSTMSTPVLDLLGGILERGRQTGVFRTDVDALDVHQIISSFCVFRTANQHTFKALFDRDMLDIDRREHQRRMLSDMVVSALTVSS